eukprot:2773944-Alexandrium_andersonii.AAC.1
MAWPVRADIRVDLRLVLELGLAVLLLDGVGVRWLCVEARTNLRAWRGGVTRLALAVLDLRPQPAGSLRCLARLLADHLEAPVAEREEAVDVAANKAEDVIDLAPRILLAHRLPDAVLRRLEVLVARHVGDDAELAPRPLRDDLG